MNNSRSEQKVQVDELVNPARCIECEKSARWVVTIGDDDDYISLYYCDDDLPDEDRPTD